MSPFPMKPPMGGGMMGAPSLDPSPSPSPVPGGALMPVAAKPKAPPIAKKNPFGGKETMGEERLEPKSRPTGKMRGFQRPSSGRRFTGRGGGR